MTSYDSENDIARILMFSDLGSNPEVRRFETVEETVPTKVTLTATRLDFRFYFSDLKDDAKREGYTVSRHAEWDFYLTGMWEQDKISGDTAADWKKRGP